MSQIEKLMTHPIPVNRDAMRVAFGGGDHWEVKPLRPGWKTFDAPPKSQIDPSGPVPEFNRIGMRFGRFTVFSLHDNKVIRWVCRCDCGKFEVRSDESVVKQAAKKRPDRAACAICMARRKVIGPLDPAEAARKAARTAKHQARLDRRRARIGEMVAESGRPWGAELPSRQCAARPAPTARPSTSPQTRRSRCGTAAAPRHPNRRSSGSIDR